MVQRRVLRLGKDECAISLATHKQALLHEYEKRIICVYNIELLTHGHVNINLLLYGTCGAVYIGTQCTRGRHSPSIV